MAIFHASAAGQLQRYRHAFLRMALSQYMTNGVSVALGLALVLSGLWALAGLDAVTGAAIGVVVTTLPDGPAPRKRKLWQMLPAPVLGLPLFMLTQWLRGDAVWLGVLLVGGTFFASLLLSWGRRGGPLSVSLLFSMLFALAVPPVPGTSSIVEHGAWFLAGGCLYLLWAVFTTTALNTRYRKQMLAECLHQFAGILQAQAERFAPQVDMQASMAAMLGQQARFAEQIQSCRDMVLEDAGASARSPLAGMLLALLEARDHQLACELDLDTLQAHDASTGALPAFQQALQAMAAAVDAWSLSMLLGRPLAPLGPVEAALDLAASAPLGNAHAQGLLRNMRARLGHIHDELGQIPAFASGASPPQFPQAVRQQWALFVSPTRWGWAALANQCSWQAPVMRYALRSALAMALGYIIALQLPWTSHHYWVLLSVVAVTRANLSQTLERRNARITGTLLGCLLVWLFLATHPSTPLVLLVLAISTSVAHAFVMRRYLYTAIAATVLGLLMGQLMHTQDHPTFMVVERMADTLVGVVVGWLIGYWLPTWESKLIPRLVSRTLQAQNQHAQAALTLLSPGAGADLPWRLARREAYDSLSALTLAAQRSVVEPEKIRHALAPLECVQAQSYQLLAQLSAVKSLLLLRPAQLDTAVASQALKDTAATIDQILRGASADPPRAPAEADFTEPPTRIDALGMQDLTPWLLRRLQLATAVAHGLAQVAKPLVPSR